MKLAATSAFLTLLFLTSILSGCAWNKGEFLGWAKKSEKKDNNESLEQVGVGKEEMAKFAVADDPVAVPVEEKKPDVETKVVEKAPAQPVIPKRASINPPRKSPSPEIAPKPVSAKKDSPVVKSIWPKDYPENLIQLEEKAALVWKNFKPQFKRDESFFLDVDYLGMTVGKVAIAYRGTKFMGTKEVHHFQARFKSAPFYSAIYELDDSVDTYVSKDDFLSLRYNLIQRESGQSVDDVQLYDREKLRTTAYYKQVRDDKVKNKTWKGFIPPHSIDPLSVLFLMRGLPFDIGQEWNIPVINKGKVLVLKTKVEARETIKIKQGTMNTVRVHAVTQYTGETLKSGDMMFWFSDDANRDLVRAKAKIKIGSVYAEKSTGD